MSRSRPALNAMLELWHTGRYRNAAELARALLVTRQRVSQLVQLAKRLELMTDEELPYNPNMIRRRA